MDKVKENSRELEIMESIIREQKRKLHSKECRIIELQDKVDRLERNQND